MCEKCAAKLAAAKGGSTRLVITHPDGSQMVHDTPLYVLVIQEKDGTQVIASASPQWLLETATPAIEQTVIDVTLGDAPAVPENLQAMIRKIIASL